MHSLEENTFGRNVYGVGTNSDIEPPQVFIRSALILGYLIAISLSILQNNFSLISVDPSIYIVSELSSDILFSDMIFISIISFISVISSTLLLHNKKKVLYSKK